jgi:hypothetical protein
MPKKKITESPQVDHNNVVGLSESEVGGSSLQPTERGASPRSPRASGKGGASFSGRSTLTPTLGELDREALNVLREFAAERLAEQRIEQQPHAACHLCGLASSPPWRGPSRRAYGLICGRCALWVEEGSHDPRDLCASILGGLSTVNTLRVPSGLGVQVGLEFFGEAERSQENASPWAHVDVALLRRTISDLASEGALRLPARWNPTRRVTW